MSDNQNSINNSKKFPQYLCRLAPAEIAAGMNAAKRNSERLFLLCLNLI